MVKDAKSTRLAPGRVVPRRARQRERGAAVGFVGGCGAVVTEQGVAGGVDPGGGGEEAGIVGGKVGVY